MHPGALDDMIMEPSHIERHFEIDCHASGLGICIYDRDFPGRHPIILDIPNADLNVIDQAIHHLLTEERERNEGPYRTMGVDVGRGDPVMTEQTYYGPSSESSMFRMEYQQEPPPRPSYDESACLMEASRRRYDAMRADMERNMAAEIAPPPDDIREVREEGHPFEMWTAPANNERSLFSQIMDRMDRPRASRQDRPRRHHNYLTWMPYSSYRKCASCFADRDLKQMRVNILRVLRYLERNSNRTRNKAAELWRGFEQSLIRYGIAIALECRQRGFSDKSLFTLRAKYRHGCSQKPDWVYWSDLQESHRAYLLLRDERRFAVKLLLQHGSHSNVRWCSQRDFCRDTGIRPRREWTLDDINTIRHVMGEVSNGQINLVNNNFYRQYGWTQDPSESFRYPEDNLCSA